MSEIPNPIITNLSTRPVKGMGAAHLERITTWATGLAHDSQYIPAIESNGKLIPLTRRDAPGLARFCVALSNIAVTMSYQGESFALEHGRTPEGDWRELTLFEKVGTVAEVSGDASDFVTDYLDIGQRVFLTQTVGRRQVKEATRSDEPGAANVMNFQDGYPITIASELSLAALNACAQELGGLPATMDHFRPNVTVDAVYDMNGQPMPFAEDYLLRAQIGTGLSMRVVRPLARCEIITQHPKTGERTHRELLKALARLHGGVDVTNGKRGLFFGMNLVHDKACQWIGVGDELTTEMSAESWITQHS